jgi:hypothetical protein
LLIAGLVLALQPIASFAQAHAPTSYAQGKGCVRPGKQDGCVVLHDIKQHRYYALSFDSSPNKPDLYTAITFEGIGYPHDSHCAEGQPVHVHEWKPLAGSCSKPASATKKPSNAKSGK